MPQKKESGGGKFLLCDTHDLYLNCRLICICSRKGVIQGRLAYFIKDQNEPSNYRSVDWIVCGMDMASVLTGPLPYSLSVQRANLITWLVIFQHPLRLMLTAMGSIFTQQQTRVILGNRKNNPEQTCNSIQRAVKSPPWGYYLSLQAKAEISHSCLGCRYSWDPENAIHGGGGRTAGRCKATQWLWISVSSAPWDNRHRNKPCASTAICGSEYPPHVGPASSSSALTLYFMSCELHVPR